MVAFATKIPQILFFISCVIVFLVVRCQEECASDDRCGADLLPGCHQPSVYGTDEEVQQRESTHLQHLPMLPQGTVILPHSSVS